MNIASPLVPGAVRVLLGIDQLVLAETSRRVLADDGYLTCTTQTVDDAIAALWEFRPHLGVVDMDIANGALLDRLASSEPRTGRMALIALTRRNDLAAKLAAFDRGADDVLTIPFPPEELVARVGAVVRRAYYPGGPFPPMLRLGELEIDVLNRCVRAGGRELRLTALDQSLLYLLAANAGRVVTRDQILDRLWGADFMPESNVVDRHIRNLRAKLHDDWRRPRYIATVPGHGYRFVAPEGDSTLMTAAS